MPPSPSVIILVADGARPDTFGAALRSGELPALARLADEGTLCTITTTFPSVTGPAYAPFLTGRHPGSVGLPGLRWFDRARAACAWPAYSRSYVGAEMRHVDRDLDPASETMFELASSRVGALSVITRGLASRERIGRGASFIARTALTHFRGDVSGWLDIDRGVANTLARRIREDRPQFAFAAFTGIDKASHQAGHDAPIVREAMRIVDAAAARIRSDAECDGRWDAMHLWIVSDHGHSPVARHEDLAGVVAGWGHRVRTHPVIFTPRADVAVMVSGNAMAHVYVELGHRTRPFWPALASRWESFAHALLARESVDLLLLPRSATACEIRSLHRGSAVLTWRGDGECAQYAYEPITGDPLGIGMRRLGEQASFTKNRLFVHAPEEGPGADALVGKPLLKGSALFGKRKHAVLLPADTEFRGSCACRLDGRH